MQVFDKHGNVAFDSDITKISRFAKVEFNDIVNEYEYDIRIIGSYSNGYYDEIVIGIYDNNEMIFVNAFSDGYLVYWNDDELTEDEDEQECIKILKKNFKDFVRSSVYHFKQIMHFRMNNADSRSYNDFDSSEFEKYIDGLDCNDIRYLESYSIFEDSISSMTFSVFENNGNRFTIADDWHIDTVLFFCASIAGVVCVQPIDESVTEPIEESSANDFSIDEIKIDLVTDLRKLHQFNIMEFI